MCSFNKQAIPRLIDLNGEAFAGITGYPELVHGDIETHDLDKLGTFVKDMVGIGAIMPDENMEDYLRMAADLPERDPESGYMDGGGQRQQCPNKPIPAVGDGDESEPKQPE